MDMILETDRLYLRYLCVEDATRMSEYRQKKEVAKYQSWKKYTENMAKRRIEECMNIKELNQVKTNYHLAIIKKSNNCMIGDLFVEVLNKKVFLLGYTLDSLEWSQGYASEMVGAFINFMFYQYSFEKVLCYVYKKNIRSRHLLEKLGFHQFEESYLYNDVGYSLKKVDF